MSSKIKVNRVCNFCGLSFEAKTTVTRYCSHQCNSRAYKLLAKGRKIEASNRQTFEKISLPIEVVKTKQYLSVAESCQLIGISRMTLHRLIKAKKIKYSTVGRRVIIRKSEIENLLQ